MQATASTRTLVGAALALGALSALLWLLQVSTPRPESIGLSERTPCDNTGEARVESFHAEWSLGAQNFDRLTNALPGHYVERYPDGFLVGSDRRLIIREDSTYDQAFCGCTGCEVTRGTVTQVAGTSTFMLLPEVPEREDGDCGVPTTLEPEVLRRIQQTGHLSLGLGGGSTRYERVGEESFASTLE